MLSLEANYARTKLELSTNHLTFLRREIRYQSDRKSAPCNALPEMCNTTLTKISHYKPKFTRYSSKSIKNNLFSLFWRVWSEQNESPKKSTWFIAQYQFIKPFIWLLFVVLQFCKNYCSFKKRCVSPEQRFPLNLILFFIALITTTHTEFFLWNCFVYKSLDISQNWVHLH